MRIRLIAYAAILCTAITVVAVWLDDISGSRVHDDASQILRMALALDREGVMSLDEAPPLAPSMYREPLPVWFMALAVKAVDAVVGAEEPEIYFEGDRVRYLKYLHLFWFVLLSVAAYWACFLFTSSTFLSLMAVLMVNAKLPLTSSGPHALGIDDLYSEQAGAALLLFGSIFLVLATRRGQLRYAAAAGLFFGLLALTKAVEHYVAIGLLAALCLLLVLPKARFPHKWTWKSVSMLIVAYGVVVGPWLYRNYNLFGSLNIAERGGVVLYLRALKDQMTAEEYRGSFYVWAPGLQPLIGRLLGYTEADLQSGGRLQRLNREPTSDFASRDSEAENTGNPDLAVSFYRKARAERVRLENHFAALGFDEPTVEADRVLQARALEMIENDLARHLAMTIPFLWRGALTTSVVLILCWSYSLAARRPDFAIFLLPASGTIAFYALFTHFIWRYSVTVAPVATVAGVVLTAPLWRYCRRRFAVLGLESTAKTSV